MNLVHQKNFIVVLVQLSSTNQNLLLFLTASPVLRTHIRCGLLLLVCRSVRLSVCHSSEPFKHGLTDRDYLWVEDSGGPKEPCIRWGSRSPMERGNFKEGRGGPLVKYRDTLWLTAQKRLNRSSCRLGFGLGWAQGSMY